MALTSGATNVPIGLVDGPVDVAHPDFADRVVRTIPGNGAGGCAHVESAACSHGTFIAGILAGRRNSASPAISCKCPLLVRPIFTEVAESPGAMPLARPEELAAAIHDCISAGARVVNLSVAISRPGPAAWPVLEEALDAAMRRHVLLVAAAGNQGTLGSSALTRHSWVIPVAGCDAAGRPMPDSNLAPSLGRRGLLAPGHEVVSLRTGGGTSVLSGTSVAVPFVTATLALLWSAAPAADAAALIRSVLASAQGPRRSVVPPLLHAEAAWRYLTDSGGRTLATHITRARPGGVPPGVAPAIRRT